MAELLTWAEVPPLLAELRTMARTLLRKERYTASLQTTALVNTALGRQGRAEQEWSEVTWANRRYFFGAMHQAMRRALVDHAERRRGPKQAPTRGVALEEWHLHDLVRTVEEAPEQMVALDAALTSLEQSPRPEQQRWAQLIEYRYYGGLTIEETAAMLEVSPATVKREWIKARLWLTQDILQRLQAAQ